MVTMACNKFESLYDDFNIYLGSFGKNFKFVFFGTIYMITVFNIVVKIAYIIFPFNIFKYSLALYIDELLAQLFIAWVFYVSALPLKDYLVMRLRK